MLSAILIALINYAVITASEDVLELAKDFTALIIIAEIDKSHLIKRKNQGWLDEYYDNVDTLIDRVRECKAAKKAISIGYHGNVVDIWEKLAEIHKKSGEQIVDLGSDQTSCHDIKGLVRELIVE